MPLRKNCDAEVRLLLVSAATEHDRDMVRLLKGMSLIHADKFYDIYRNILEMDNNDTSVRVARLFCQNFSHQLARENPTHRLDVEEEEPDSEEESSDEEISEEEEEQPATQPERHEEGILSGGTRRPVSLKNEVRPVYMLFIPSISMHTDYYPIYVCSIKSACYIVFCASVNIILQRDRYRNHQGT